MALRSGLFNSTDIKICGVWVYANSPPYAGEQRINHWEAKHECVPLGLAEVRA